MEPREGAEAALLLRYDDVGLNPAPDLCSIPSLCLYVHNLIRQIFCRNTHLITTDLALHCGVLRRETSAAKAANYGILCQ